MHLSAHTTKAVDLTPGLVAPRPLDPEGQKHPIDLGGKDVIKEVGADPCVTEMLLIFSPPAENLWVSQPCFELRGPSCYSEGNQSWLGKLHIAGLFDSLHNILGTD